MQASYQIRLIGNEYCLQVQEMVLAIQQDEFHLPVTLETQPDMQDIDYYFTRQGGAFWGAFIGEELIGTIGIIKADEKIGIIRKMFVHQAFRGSERGIAKALLSTLLQFCRSGGMQQIYLGTTEPLKAAHRFYEKNGFKPIPQSALPPCFQYLRGETRYYHLSLN